MASVVSSTLQILEILLMAICMGCVRLYTERQTMEGYITSMPTLSEHDLTSQNTMCSRLCNRHGNCTSYFENSETRQCRLVTSLLDTESGNLTKVAGWKYYARVDCDTEKGYVFDTQSSICIKYFPKFTKISAAQTICAEDGGRLLEIRSQSQQVALATYLASLGTLHSYGPTIAGRRTNNNSPWLFDDGTPLTYFNWDTIATQPAPLDDRHCIRIEYNRKYYWAGALCHRKQPFLCQVP